MPEGNVGFPLSPALCQPELFPFPLEWFSFPQE